MKRILLVAIVLTALISCNSKKKLAEEDEQPVGKMNNTSNGASENKTLGITNAESEIKYMLQYKTTSCYGRCPVYDFELFEDKTCTINGKLFYKVEGKNEGQLSDEQFQNLEMMIDSLDFFELQDVYDDTLLMDATTYYIALNIEGNYKQVKCRVNTPAHLRLFLSRLEAIIDEIDWKPIK